MASLCISSGVVLGEGYGLTIVWERYRHGLVGAMASIVSRRRYVYQQWGSAGGRVWAYYCFGMLQA